MSGLGRNSLEEVHESVQVPTGSWWRRMLAFAGPAYMVSVGYMDPGNWATDIEGGARFGYTLIWVLLMSNLMAVLLQTLSARLGLVVGRDLAQACRDEYRPIIGIILFILCEIAIAATDLAELLGSAIGMNMLFGIPLVWAVIITGFDVLLLLAIQRLGMRKMEAMIVGLIAVVGICFIIQLFLSQPSWKGIAQGFIPQPLHGGALYIAIGMLGATVMPHNLYLHSALVQSRGFEHSLNGLKKACRFNMLDSIFALNMAFFVNAAILIVAAAAFHSRGIVVTEIQEAHSLLNGVLGTKVAATAFALALLAAGQSSTITGTIAGQVTMEGFLHFHIQPWLRRLITRGIAIVPAVIVIVLLGDRGTLDLLILSQVILSLQLPFAVVPLVRFTNSRRKMGSFASPLWVKSMAWVVTAIIIALNGLLVWQQVSEWYHGAGNLGWLVLSLLIPLVGALGALLAWMTFRPEYQIHVPTGPSAMAIADGALQASHSYARIGVALEATPDDRTMLAEALAMAKYHDADLILMHVVQGVGGQWRGQMTNDTESRHDERYLVELSEYLNAQLTGGKMRVSWALGYGNVPRELVRLGREHNLDLIVTGGHGHKRLADVLRGETITAVRHDLGIPMLAVRDKQ